MHGIFYRINTATVFFFADKRKRIDAAETAGASKSTNGIGCSRTTRTMIVRVYSWTGSCFLLAAYVDVTLSTTASFHLVVEIDTEIDKLPNVPCKFSRFVYF